MTEPAWTAGRAHRRVLAISAVAVLALAVVLGVAGTAAWGGALRDDQRLLPGTIIAGVDVGEQDVAAAADALRAAVETRLETPVEVVHDDRRWSTTPRELGATVDVDAAVAAGLERTQQAGLLELARARVGALGTATWEVEVDVPHDTVRAFVHRVAEDVDLVPQDAVLTWSDEVAGLQESTTGLRVLRDDAVEALQAAVVAGSSTVTLPVEEHAPDFATDDARQVADAVTTAVEDALDHAVTVTLADSTRTVTPRRLGAAHDAQALLDARTTDPDVTLTFPEGAVHAVVDEVAAEQEVAAVNARLDWTRAGGFAATPGQTGLALDHAAAEASLEDALRGASSAVLWELQTTQPSITTDSFGTVILVRQADREVDLVRGGQVVRTWQVAVGTSGYDTPTGMFTIGAKRFEPTWVNSSPDGWGSDMPARIGPGPDNPLGLRALNWMDGARDTLIRFHGTANEASIGRAASHGCVRMTNPDVIELFDLVDTGTVVVSAI